jgi:hypothetical protein
MYCPSCGQEYREGVTVCRDCGAILTQDPPATEPEPRPEWLDLETVFESSDPALLPVVRSLLESEGIPVFARGELLQDVLGWGRMLGTNLITGPVRLQVPRERAEEARRLLSVMKSDGLEAPADPLDE